MELNKTRNWIFVLTALMTMLIMGLGVWWLYLLVKLSNTLKEIKATHSLENMKFISLVKYEGLTFLILIFIVMALLIYFYWQDQKKSKAIQSFFASLSHELRTPLTSVKLQAEVIEDMTKDSKELAKLVGRLIQGTTKLESELEKSLQLARVERNGNLVLRPVDLNKFIEKLVNKNSAEFKIEVIKDKNIPIVLAEENALEVIFRNLFENTKRHNGQDSSIEIKLKSDGHKVELLYNDHGKEFKGQRKKLGTLFYKHGSDKGSGIGLYLIKKLMTKMNGALSFKFDESNRLVFRMNFKNYETT